MAFLSAVAAVLSTPARRAILPKKPLLFFENLAKYSSKHVFRRDTQLILPSLFLKPLHIRRDSKGGDEYYKAALLAAWEGRYEESLSLADEAALCYREDGMVHVLARLRVNQLITRYLSQSSDEERFGTRTTLLDKAARIGLIESIEPPFEPEPVEKALARIGLKLSKTTR